MFGDRDASPSNLLQENKGMFTPVLPSHVNAFNMATGLKDMNGIDLQQAMTPEEPTMAMDIAAKQEQVMNSINAPNSLPSSVPFIKQMDQSDFAAVTNTVSQATMELGQQLFGIFSDPEPEVDLTAELDRKLQMNAAPRPPSGMGIGSGIG